jgi:hypothetical protein
MANNYLDRSNYVKGLLLLIGKDKKITSGERDFLHAAGRTLSFDKRFIENAINELFENKHLGTEPPVFSQKQYAEAFLRDAIQLALVDNDLSGEEIDWLYATAVANDVPGAWLENQIEHCQSGVCAQESRLVEVEKIFAVEEHI